METRKREVIRKELRFSRSTQKTETLNDVTLCSEDYVFPLPSKYYQSADRTANCFHVLKKEKKSILLISCIAAWATQWENASA